MNQKGFISSVFGIIITLLIAAGVGGYVYIESQMPIPEDDFISQCQAMKQCPDGSFVRACGKDSPACPSVKVACTLEAKQCPDGSYVGRTGPNCEFAACPEAVPNKWHSKEACEAATQKVCDFEMCDYLCPEGFENGWVATQKDL